MSKLILSNNTIIDEPSEAQIVEAFKSLANEPDCGLTMNRPVGRYLKIWRTSENAFAAEYQIDRPMIRFQSSPIHCGVERAAEILYFYSKGWSPKDFLDITWTKREVIDTTLHSIKIFSRIMRTMFFAQLIGAIIVPAVIQRHGYEFMLSVCLSGIFAETDSYYLRYKFGEQFYYQMLVVQIMLFVVLIGTLLRILWNW